MPIINDDGKKLDIDIVDLPKPDEEVRIVDGVGERESTRLNEVVQQIERVLQQMCK